MRGWTSQHFSEITPLPGLWCLSLWWFLLLVHLLPLFWANSTFSVRFIVSESLPSVPSFSHCLFCDSVRRALMYTGPRESSSYKHILQILQRVQVWFSAAHALPITSTPGGSDASGLGGHPPQRHIHISKNNSNKSLRKKEPWQMHYRIINLLIFLVYVFLYLCMHACRVQRIMRLSCSLSYFFRQWPLWTWSSAIWLDWLPVSSSDLSTSGCSALSLQTYTVIYWYSRFFYFLIGARNSNSGSEPLR